MDYDVILDNWSEKIVLRAEKYKEKYEEVKLGSADYYKFRAYYDSLYMALAMLSNEERIYKRKHKSKRQ